MKWSQEKRERLTSLWTIVAAVVTTIALGLGFMQFSCTQAAQRELTRLQREDLELQHEIKAIELFNEYNRLMRDGANGDPGSNEDFWKDNLGIALAASIYDLVGEDKAWRNTVRWMLERHGEFIEKHRLNCDTYSGEFKAIVQTLHDGEVCVAASP